MPSASSIAYPCAGKDCQVGPNESAHSSSCISWKSLDVRSSAEPEPAFLPPPACPGQGARLHALEMQALRLRHHFPSISRTSKHFVPTWRQVIALIWSLTVLHKDKALAKPQSYFSPARCDCSATYLFPHATSEGSRRQYVLYPSVLQSFGPLFSHGEGQQGSNPGAHHARRHGTGRVRL